VTTIQHEVWIHASKVDVFEAITTKQGLDSWWGTALNAEPQVGYVVEFDHGLGETLRMRITDVIPNGRLEWTCISDYRDPGNPASEWLGHRLIFELETAPDDPQHAWLRQRLFAADPDGDITILRFQHAGWSNDSRWYSFCNTAWGVTLAGVQQYCEGAASRPTDG
jgi:uncharacterized protein YndB with AHSA1/START domain